MNIVIVGGTGGIGTSILDRLINKDHNFFIGSKNKNNVDYICEKYAINGSEIDVTDLENFSLFFEKANKYLDEIDVIINCVGSILLKPSHLASFEEILQTYQLNIFNSIGTIKYGIKYLRKKGGSIILFSSAAAEIGLKNHDIISSAKGAINSLVKSAAISYANYNIRVNAIAPGLVKTNLSDKIVQNEESMKYSLKLHPLKRLGEPKNIGGCVEWLIDRDSDWVTGQIVTIDGGLSTLKI